jgi:hypothetical protein
MLLHDRMVGLDLRGKGKKLLGLSSLWWLSSRLGFMGIRGFAVRLGA